MIKTKELKQKTVGAHDCAQKMIKKNCRGGACSAQGITLIALVITIVVMLILVGVTINMAVNGGLFTHAGKAVSDTQNAIDAEQALANGEIKIGDSWYNSMDDYLNGVESVRSLQEKYQFTYYSSLLKAVTDVNNNTRENADSDKENAVAGIYTENGETYVVLLKDSTEETRIQPSVNMTINLGGCTLSSNDTVCIDSISGNVTIDGRLKGSTIQVDREDGNLTRPIQVRSGNFLVDSGTYIGNSNGASNTCIFGAGNIMLLNLTIICTDTDRQAAGVKIAEGGSLSVSDCDIKATVNSGMAWGIIAENASAVISNCNISTTATQGQSLGVENKTNASTTVSNSTIKSYANYSGSLFSRGILNEGTITINNCYVMGTHEGVANQGTLYVNGGTYEGFGFGGFYFSGEGTTSYVRNVTIRECAMPEGYTATVDSANAGFLIGGSATSNNIKVYMDNCDIYGNKQPIVLRGVDGEQNNTIHCI